MAKREVPDATWGTASLCILPSGWGTLVREGLYGLLGVLRGQQSRAESMGSIYSFILSFIDGSFLSTSCAQAQFSAKGVFNKEINRPSLLWCSGQETSLK